MFPVLMKKEKQTNSMLVDSLLSYEPSKLIQLLKNILTQKKNHQLVIFMDKGYKVANICDIILIRQENRHTYVYLKDGSVIPSYKSLIEYERHTRNSNFFFKTEKLNLINLFHIKELFHKNSNYLVMSNEMEVPVAKENYSLLLERLNLFNT